MADLTYYDFFAGVGLAELGLQAASWRCAWANDNDPRKFAIYQQNFDAGKYHLGNVEEVEPSQLPTPVDMAWASFPCQDLSLAGWRRGLNARRSGAFWSFHALMEDLHERGVRPPVIVIENVTGLLYDKDFSGLSEALASLDLQFGAVVIDGKHFVPQSRPRVFVIAVDKALDIDRFTTPTPVSTTLTPKSVIKAWDSLSHDARDLWRWWQLPEPTGGIADVADLIEDNPTEVEWHSDDDTVRLLSLMSEVNLAKVNAAKQSGGRRVGFVYKRTRRDGQRAEARFDGIAGCLRTTNGGSSRQTVIVTNGDLIRSRLLSPREAARLMGVPETYQLSGRYNDLYRAMGDGVVVPAVEWLADHLLTPVALQARQYANECNAEPALTGV